MASIFSVELRDMPFCMSYKIVTQQFSPVFWENLVSYSPFEIKFGPSVDLTRTIQI